MKDKNKYISSKQNTAKFKDLLPPKVNYNLQSHKKQQTSAFDNVTAQETSSAKSSSYGDLIDLLSVSPSAGDKPITFTDKLSDFCIMFLKYSFLVAILTINFLGLSASLNCNADQELSHRVMSAIFAFFFGFVYLLINYYTYKVMYQKKICTFNKDKLFPFKA
uniref:Uncharacterized protein n=1 Tax=viral metagenome TaxID=1070528 RepID=A0A6C0HLX7_9ZZZZ